MPPDLGLSAGAPRRTGDVAAGSWHDRARALRDRLLASPRFQRWAAAFPLTRPIAERRARAVFDLCAGFVYAQVLCACVRLHLFELLFEEPRTVDELSQQLALSPDATTRLLGAAAALGLVERRSRDRFGLGLLGAAVIGNPAIAAMVEHHALLYDDLRDPVALLRGDTDTALARYWAYAGAERPATLETGRVGPYSALMATSQTLIADEVLDAYPLGHHRCLLDVGGGEGAFIAAAAARAPHLRLILFDLPAVADRARTRLAAAGLGARAEAVGGDWLSDPLPEGADIVTLIRIIHDHDDATALAILRAVRRALPEAGTLVLAEPMSGTPGAERVTDAYFAFYLLAMGRGRPRTPAELEELLARAGFDRIRPLRTRRPLFTRVLLARPKKSVNDN